MINNYYSLTCLYYEFFVTVSDIAKHHPRLGQDDAQSFVIFFNLKNLHLLFFFLSFFFFLILIFQGTLYSHFNDSLVNTILLLYFSVNMLSQGSKFIFGLGSTCATRCKFLGARWTLSPRRTCLQGSLHSHLSVESLKNRKGYEMNWKQCVNRREKRQIKHMLIQGKWCNFIVWSLNVSYLRLDLLFQASVSCRTCWST